MFRRAGPLKCTKRGLTAIIQVYNLSSLLAASVNAFKAEVGSDAIFKSLAKNSTNQYSSFNSKEPSSQPKTVAIIVLIGNN
jgi:hypothetical protein